MVFLWRHTHSCGIMTVRMRVYMIQVVRIASMCTHFLNVSFCAAKLLVSVAVAPGWHDRVHRANWTGPLPCHVFIKGERGGGREGEGYIAFWGINLRLLPQRAEVLCCCMCCIKTSYSHWRINTQKLFSYFNNVDLSPMRAFVDVHEIYVSCKLPVEKLLIL